MSKLILLLLLISCDTSNEPRNFKMSDGGRGHKECEIQDNGYTILTQKQFDLCNEHMFNPKFIRNAYYNDNKTGCLFKVKQPFWGRGGRFTKKAYLGRLYCKNLNGKYELMNEFEYRLETSLTQRVK
jgi:hypothetical protein